MQLDFYIYKVVHCVWSFVQYRIISIEVCGIVKTLVCFLVKIVLYFQCMLFACEFVFFVVKCGVVNSRLFVDAMVWMC